MSVAIFGLIVHKTEQACLLCYVDHHDEAYRWAERRKLETHPKTGAAQLVEIRETVQEIIVPRYEVAKSSCAAKPRLFDHVADEELLSYGVPPEWLADVREANEDSLLTLADHLPSEAAEALLELATGGTRDRRVAVAEAAADYSGSALTRARSESSKAALTLTTRSPIRMRSVVSE